MLHKNNEGESVGAAECLILSRFTHQHQNLLLGILACLIYQGHIVWLYWLVVSFQNIISTCYLESSSQEGLNRCCPSTVT